ncbi:unnamed protein product [Linum tenue]|uniref:Uncharacterized protein n=1 Tax=Linum tenue TaxID=586396 RepID=A0AAV0P9D6_9ROSI|nr:unnamed protein product [Linum tenue]
MRARQGDRVRVAEAQEDQGSLQVRHRRRPLRRRRDGVFRAKEDQEPDRGQGQGVSVLDHVV